MAPRLRIRAGSVGFMQLSNPPPRTLRFAAILVLGLGVLTWLGSLAIGSTARRWFERDIASRAQAVLSSSRRALTGALRGGDRRQAHQLLEDMAQDERLLAAGVCDAHQTVFATSRDYPAMFSCAE